MTLSEQLNKMKSLMKVINERTLDRQTLINAAIANADDINEMWRQAFLNKPEIAMREIAEQLNSSESEARTTRKIFGATICDIALTLFPDAQVGL